MYFHFFDYCFVQCYITQISEEDCNEVNNKRNKEQLPTVVYSMITQRIVTYLLLIRE